MSGQTLRDVIRSTPAWRVFWAITAVPKTIILAGFLLISVPFVTAHKYLFRRFF